METERLETTVYYDGSCPLCRAEIGYYRRNDTADAFCFIDISKPDAPPPQGVTKEDAMKRFHVRAVDGQVVSGAAAFVEIWGRLPRWRWAARLASLPGGLAVLEWAYRIFLPARPVLSRFSRRFLGSKLRWPRKTRQKELASGSDRL